MNNSFEKFDTRTRSNEGVQIFLKDAEDKPTLSWIRVLGIDADAFQLANRAMRANVLLYLEEKGLEVKKTPEYLDFTLQEQRKLNASLVTEWSFDEPCTPENVIKLLTVAPYIATQIDETASKRSQFVKL